MGQDVRCPILAGGDDGHPLAHLQHPDHRRVDKMDSYQGFPGSDAGAGQHGRRRQDRPLSDASRCLAAFHLSEGDCFMGKDGRIHSDGT